MSYTDTTANLKLPQWQENDYPSWLNDVNSAFRSIDQNAGEQDSSIQQALTEVSDARTLATKASNDVTSLSGEVNSVKSDVSEIRELATAASTTANSAMDVAEIAQDNSDIAIKGVAEINNNLQSWTDQITGVKYVALNVQDSNGNITKVQASKNTQGFLETAWSSDSGNSFKVFSIGTAPTSNIERVFFLNLDANSGFILRLLQTNNIWFDIHFGLNELTLYITTDGGSTFRRAWYVDIKT